MHDALERAHSGARYVLRALYTADATAIGGALSSPWWWHYVDEAAHFIFFLMGAVSLGLTIAIKIRALRRPPQ